jgi:hypothetical protein
MPQVVDVAGHGSLAVDVANCEFRHLWLLSSRSPSDNVANPEETVPYQPVLETLHKVVSCLTEKRNNI